MLGFQRNTAKIVSNFLDTECSRYTQYEIQTTHEFQAEKQRDLCQKVAYKPLLECKYFNI